MPYLIPFTLALILSFALSGCSPLFFYPAKTHLQTPSALGLVYQDVELVAEDGTPIHAWFLPTTGQARGRVLYLHGNAENISTHIYNVHWLPKAGYEVLLLDYRGFGHSGGNPALPGIFADIDAAIDWMSESANHQEQGFFILGQSIGASLMLHAAVAHTENPQLCGLISDAAFTRYRDIADYLARQSWITWPFHFPIFWSANDPYDPIDALGHLTNTPILFFHSADDRIIPFANLDLLLTAHQGSHRAISTNGRHTATFMDKHNRQALVRFLNEENCARAEASAISKAKL